MWIFIILLIGLFFGPTRRMIANSWRFCIPAIIGAVIGYELGRFTFGAYPGFEWVPWAWAVILGALFGSHFKGWLDKTLGGGG